MIRLFRLAGEGADYWGTRYLQAVRRDGGLATARQMLQPRNADQRKGLDALLQAGKPELTLEALLLEDRFTPLFTEGELAEAQLRLGDFKVKSNKLKAERERLYPDEVEPGLKYIEGARKQIRVNAYERNAAARTACLKHHGVRCAACQLEFAERYGMIGKNFIHVHHKRSLASVPNGYEVDPVQDLVPVCPNCHAMLHRTDPAMSIEDLRTEIVLAAKVSPRALPSPNARWPLPSMGAA